MDAPFGNTLPHALTSLRWQKVQRCQQEESELKQRLQQAKQVVSQTLIANATRVKQQSQKAKQKLAAKLRQELAEKRNAARDQRVRAAALKTSRGMASAHAESSADMIRKQKNEWMEKRRRSQEAAQRKAEKQREVGIAILVLLEHGGHNTADNC